MNMNFKSWLIGTTMLAMTATGAFAEVVLNRGNSMDPESLDPHKTSTVNEAHVLRDLFMGLTMQDAKAAVIQAITRVDNGVAIAGVGVDIK